MSDPVTDAAPDAGLTSPLDAWLVRAGVTRGRGLEIGPLDKPRLTKDRFRVLYVDHAPTEVLREKYRDDGAMRDHLDDIVDVDLVWDGSVPLGDAIGDEAPFDFVLASHVAEHAADLIGWLRNIGSALTEGGRLCLALPDKRLCFDVNRDLTTMADLVDAHLRVLTAPGYRQIYDFHSRMVAVDAAAMWAGIADYRGIERDDVDPDQWGYEQCLTYQRTGEYIDGHCQVFTPGSFLDLYRRLVGLGLIDYAIADFEPSQLGTIEFRVTLETLPAAMDADERRRAQLASIPAFTDTVPPAPSEPIAPPVRPPLRLSDREEQAVRAKRRAMESARGLISRIRRPSGTA